MVIAIQNPRSIAITLPCTKENGVSKRGRGTSKKPVVALVSREGDVRCKPVENVTAATLHSEIHATVAKESTILTDELSSSGRRTHWLLSPTALPSAHFRFILT